MMEEGHGAALPVVEAAAAASSGKTLPVTEAAAAPSTWADPSRAILPVKALPAASQPKASKRPRGLKRRLPSSFCQRLRLPWPFTAATGSAADGKGAPASPLCESGSEEEEDEDSMDAATAATIALSGLGLRSSSAAGGAGPDAMAKAVAAAALGRSASSASLALSRVGSEGSDLSGYVIGADISAPQPPPHQHQQHQGLQGGMQQDDDNVVVVQLECPRCQCVDRRVVPTPQDSAAAAAVAAAFAVGVGGNGTGGGALAQLLPSTAAAAMERSRSAGSLSLLLDASGGSSGSGRLSRMPSFRLPSFSLLSSGSSSSLSGAAAGAAAAAAAAAAPPAGAVVPMLQLGPPVPSASALQLQQLLGVELTAEEHREREQVVAAAAAAAAMAVASVNPVAVAELGMSVSSASATSSEAATSEDGEGESQASPLGLEDDEEEGGGEGEGEAGKPPKSFEDMAREEAEADPHLALARDVVLELKRGEKLYRPPASLDAATVVLPQQQGQGQPSAQHSAAAGAGAGAGGGLPPLMRAVIVDWVLDIHARLKLGPQSLYLAVLILDRFTAQVSLDRPELQLLALASLLVASKHEDVTAPSIKTMLRFTENMPGSGAGGAGPPKAQLLHMERRVLEVLGFAFARPTAADFLDVLLGLGDAALTSTSSSNGSSSSSRRKARGHPLGAGGVVLGGSSCGSYQHQQGQHGGQQAVPLLHARARYLAERALFDGGLVAKFAPSRIAAGAVYLARRHDTPDAWTSELEAWSGYSEGEALEMARRIAALSQEPLPLVGTRRLTALTRKYASARLREVAAMTCLPLP